MKVIDVTVDEIIDLGLEIARNDGFSALTIRDVATAARVSVGTVYNLFGDKDTLVGRIMERFWRQTLHVDLERIEAEAIPFLPKIARVYQLFRLRSTEFHNTLMQNFSVTPKLKDDARCTRMDYMQLIGDRIVNLLAAYPKLDSKLQDPNRRSELAVFIADSILSGVRRSAPSLGFVEELLFTYLITLAPNAEDEIR
ncbi:MAG TPA: TetR/AcrR family transcriptional regulator [Bellilinea sp.]|mgnify:FL=1|nr:TetR/AcrR family transcriptional regulator [Bellilinea sp.]